MFATCALAGELSGTRRCCLCQNERRQVQFACEAWSRETRCLSHQFEVRLGRIVRPLVHLQANPRGQQDVLQGAQCINHLPVREEPGQLPRFTPPPHVSRSLSDSRSVAWGVKTCAAQRRVDTALYSTHNLHAEGMFTYDIYIYT